MAVYDITPSGDLVSSLAYDGTLDVAGTQLAASAIEGVEGRAFAGCKVAANLFAIAWNEATTQDTYLQLVDTSSGTPVPGTAVNVETTAADCNKISLSVAPGGSKIWMAYGKNLGSKTGQLKTFTYSGTTPTLDATVDLGDTYTGTVPAVSVQALTDTRAHVTYEVGANLHSRGCAAGSGTLTLDASGATLIARAASCSGITQQFLSTTRSIVMYSGATETQSGRVITTSGATTSNSTQRTLGAHIGLIASSSRPNKGNMVFNGVDRGLALCDYRQGAFTIVSNAIPGTAVDVFGQGFWGSGCFVETIAGVDYYLGFTHTDEGNTGYLVRGFAYDSNIATLDRIILGPGAGQFQGDKASHDQFCRANAIFMVDTRRAIALYPKLTDNYPLARVINF